MAELIIAIALWPFTAIFGFCSLVIYFYYCPIQLIALLMTNFLRKKRILASGSPLVHYVVAFIIGHIMYSVIVYWIFTNFVTFF